MSKTASFNDPGPTSVAGPKPPPNVVRGPADADNYRIKVGRFRDRWYRDPLPSDDIAPATATDDEAYPSVSTVKGASGKDWTYTTLKRIAQSDDLAELAGKSFFERYERFKVINSLDLSAAMRRGTNVHTWAECLSYGIPQFLTSHDDGAAYFNTVDRLFRELNPELVAAEFVCIHRHLNNYGYGGTSDGIFVIDGKRYMVDWKSRGEDSDHGVYPEEAAQLGAYCGAEYIITEDPDERNPHGARRRLMPDLDGGLIVSIKPDSYEVYPVDIPKAVDHFADMHAWWAARRSERAALGSKWAPRREVTEPEPDPELLDRKEALLDRHAQLTKAQTDEFAERATNIDVSDLDAIEALIDELENPPTVLDMAQARMAKDAEREADRRLSAEGGPADPTDVKLFELRWDEMTPAARRWVGDVVRQADETGDGFRLSELNSQRRADIYCALTEWSQCEFFDAESDELFEAVIYTVNGDSDATVGGLTTADAALLRGVVTQIENGQMTYVVGPDSKNPSYWRATNPSES